MIIEILVLPHLTYTMELYTLYVYLFTQDQCLYSACL